MTAAAWAKDVVLQLARVPAQPHVPEGAQESVRVFHPGRNYLTWRLIRWGIANAAIAFVIFTAFGFSRIPTIPPLLRGIWLAVASVAAGVFLASLPVTYFLQCLNYEMRWYIVTDRSLRIRGGVVQLQELTMTFANIQEIRVTANPIEKLLGLADVEVRSAGGGQEGSSGHVGSFEGVDNAEAIRDLIVERLRVYRDSGLGEKPTHAEEPPALTAARDVLKETLALRDAYASHD